MIPPSCTFSRGRLLPFRAWHLPVNVNSSPADHPIGLLITSHCKASVQSPVHHAAPSDRCSPCPPSAIGPVDPDIPARTFRWRHPSRILGNSVLDPSRIVTRLLGSPPSSQRSRAAVAHRLFTPRGQVTSLFAWACGCGRLRAFLGGGKWARVPDVRTPDRVYSTWRVDLGGGIRLQGKHGVDSFGH